MGADEIEERFGGRLRRLRSALGYSQARVATEIGAYQTTIAKIETGVRRIGLSEAVRIASVFGLTVDEMVSEDRVTATVVVED